MRFAPHLPGCSVTAPKQMNVPFLSLRDRVRDPEFPALQAQLTVFAREVGALYSAERTRSRELDQALMEVQDTYLATMMSFAQVVEAKDRTTAGHLDRTQWLGLKLAAAVDPDLAALPETRYGFFLHDIGKVGIPEHILCKPAPLDREEWLVMREHPTIGVSIVEPIRFLRGAVDVVRSHHERWDGTGYPQGLRGADIPVAGRVMAVVDVYDAVRARTLYDRSLSHDDTVKLIVDGRSTHFDPAVVEAFLSVSARFRAVSDEALRP